MRIIATIEVPDGRYCSGKGYSCRFYFAYGEEGEWCEVYERAIEDMQKCAPCAHPEV